MKNRLQLLTIATLLIATSSLFSQNKSELNQIFVSGQITEKSKGNPIFDHKIIVESKTSIFERDYYYKEVFTDHEGYYFDTIYTSLSKGAFKITTHDQIGNELDTVLHFRIDEKSNNILIADFVINYQGSTNDIQARFEYINELSSDNLTYQFIDITQCDSIIQREWEFGDGTTSTTENPIHIYRNYGLYKVKLSLLVMFNGEEITSEITKRIYATAFDFYHMGGHAFSNHFPIDEGYAYLYQIDRNNIYTPIDTSYFDTLGYYYFYQIPEGKYIVKIEPSKESLYYGILLPTYYGNEFFWQNAETINLSSTSWEYDIQLDISDGVINGNGLIGGNVQYINNLKNSFSNDYAEGIQVYLFDEQTNKLTYRYSGKRGDFDFDLINIDGYYVYPEITGVVTEKKYVELTNLNPNINDLKININLNNFNDAETNNISDLLLVNAPYPNPANDVVIVKINDNSDNLSFNVFNINGQKVLELEDFNKSEKTVSFSIKNLDNGTYILHAENRNSSTNHLFVVAK